MGFAVPRLGFVLVLFLFGSEALTPTKIAAADVPTQQSLDLVVDLPGQPNVSFSHFAGYVTVNESHGRALFYWFFEAVSDPSSKPVILWLNGGPGCSSVGYGEAEELGPLRVNKDGASVSLNKKSWNNEANLLFLESPAGVGFSYSNTTDDYTEFGDTQTALDSYAFLVGWFKRFPEYMSHDFYIAGESYAGHYVPQLAKLVTDNAAAKLVPKPKGILIGNAVLNDGLDDKGIVDFAWSHAIVSDAFYQNISNACNFSSESVSDECVVLFNLLYNKYSPINIYSIYSDVCLSTTNFSGSVFSVQDEKFFSSRNAGPPKRQLKAALNRKIRNGRAGGYDPCIDNYVYEYLNRPDVQRALHANGTDIPYPWSPCSDVINTWADSPSSMLPTMKALIASGLRVWVFNGDMDGRIPVLSSRYSVGAMHLPTEIDWYPWFHNSQVGGWSEVYKGLTYATVRGAGHMVPTFQPGRSLALVTSFLAGTALPNSSQS